MQSWQVRMAVGMALTLGSATGSGAQERPPADYLVLDTLRTSTMQEELQEAAERGYRLVPGQGAWTLSAILERTEGEAAAVDYLLLATSRSGTMQREMDEAAADGYRFASILGIGSEVIVAMQRERGRTDQTHEQRLLATTQIDTMERELRAEAAQGFRFVGQTVFERLFGDPEFVAIVERRVDR